MNTILINCLKDALSCAVHQSETGIVKGGLGKLADIIEREFQIPVGRIKVELMDLDYDEIFKGNNSVLVIHGDNNSLSFADKSRYGEHHVE